MECSKVLHSRLVRLKKDLAQRKHRAITHCNPCVYTHYSPSCTLVWDSIERHERYLEEYERLLKNDHASEQQGSFSDDHP